MDNSVAATAIKKPNLEDARGLIESLDFTDITNKMVKRDGWIQREVKKLERLYRNYLFLMYKYRSQHSLPPSEELDEFWHNHILDTQRYRHDCQAIFGEYIDHYPYFGSDEKTNFADLENAFDTMRELHRQEFGYDLYVVRSFFSPLITRLKLLFKPKPKAA